MFQSDFYNVLFSYNVGLSNKTEMQFFFSYGKYKTKKKYNCFLVRCCNQKFLYKRNLLVHEMCSTRETCSFFFTDERNILFFFLRSRIL